MPIRTQAHQGSPPLSLLEFAGEVCVALTVTDFVLWTVTPGLVTAGLVTDTVVVRVFVLVCVLVCVLVLVSAVDVAVVRVPASDFAGAVTLLAWSATFETFGLAC